MRTRSYHSLYRYRAGWVRRGPKPLGGRSDCCLLLFLRHNRIASRPPPLSVHFQGRAGCWVRLSVDQQVGGKGNQQRHNPSSVEGSRAESARRVVFLEGGGLSSGFGGKRDKTAVQVDLHCYPGPCLSLPSLPCLSPSHLQPDSSQLSASLRGLQLLQRTAIPARLCYGRSAPKVVQQLGPSWLEILEGTYISPNGAPNTDVPSTNRQQSCCIQTTEAEGGRSETREASVDDSSGSMGGESSPKAGERFSGATLPDDRSPTAALTSDQSSLIEAGRSMIELHPCRGENIGETIR